MPQLRSRRAKPGSAPPASRRALATIIREPDTVETRADLVGYIEELRRNLATNRGGWKNANLDDFLEALARYVDDIDGWFMNRGEPMPDQATWKLVAQLLAGARIYE